MVKENSLWKKELNALRANPLPCKMRMTKKKRKKRVIEILMKKK